MEEKKSFFVVLKNNWWKLSLIALLILVAVLIGISIGGGDKFTSAPESARIEIRAESYRNQAAIPSGLEWCARLNQSESMHIPHLIMGMEPEAESIFPNNISGYNWIMQPNFTGNESVGILSDGTYFIKYKLLERFSPTHVEIKPAEMGYSLFTMKEGTVNGEKSFVWNKNQAIMNKY